MNQRQKRRKKQTTANDNLSNTGIRSKEDSESADGTMEKFEELNRIQHKLSSSFNQDASNIQTKIEQQAQHGNSQLKQKQLEVLRCTSAFTVKRASLDAGPTFAMDFLQEEYRSDSPDENIEEDVYHYMAEDHDELHDSDYQCNEKYHDKCSGETSVGKKRLQPKDRQSVLNKHKQTKNKGRNPATMEKRVCDADLSLPTYVKIPPRPIEVSWIHSIKSLSPNTSPTDFKYYEVDRLVSQDLTQYGKQFQAIYMDPPFLMTGEPPTRGKVDIEDFAKMNIPEIIETGFLFVWVEKEWVHRVVGIARGWDFKYVENYCWIKKNINNTIYKGASHYFCKSKLNLLMFKKQHCKKSKIEIRHQRNADCLFDFVKPLKSNQLTETKPAHIYHVIETLLPTAVQDSKLLELWARRNTRRQGWTTVVDLYIN